MGGIGIPLTEFNKLYFEEFESIFKAWKEKNEARERQEWERMRILATICIQPHIKGKITPKQLLPMPWDNNKIMPDRTTQHLTKEQQRARFEKLAKRSC